MWAVECGVLGRVLVVFASRIMYVRKFVQLLFAGAFILAFLTVFQQSFSARDLEATASFIFGVWQVGENLIASFSILLVDLEQ